MANTVKLTFGYGNNSAQTRQYSFGDVADSLIADVKDNILAVNASLTGGTAGGLSSFFIDDDGNNFTGITAAQIVAESETVIDLSAGGASSAS